MPSISRADRPLERNDLIVCILNLIKRDVSQTIHNPRTSRRRAYQSGHGFSLHNTWNCNKNSLSYLNLRSEGALALRAGLGEAMSGGYETLERSSRYLAN